MYVVLYNPAPRSGWQAQRRIELPLSLLCPATPLDRQGHRVKIVEGFDNPKWKAELDRALDEKPICFGVTSMTGPQILHALRACELVKRRRPDVPTVWGGIHASLMPAQTIAHPAVDIVVVGEGEATFPELVKALQSGTPLSTVRGIWYKDGASQAGASPVDPQPGGEPKTVGIDGDCQAHWTGERPFVDMDAQPPLSYHLVDMDHYRRRLFGLDHVSFNSSRGCVFRCKFCWDPVMHKRKWRAMQPDTVIDQLKRIVRDYDIRGFLFTDDNFFVDMARAYAILEGVVRADLGISISKLQIRTDEICRMDRDFLELLVRANVKRVSVGVESASQRVLDLIGKDQTVEQILEAHEKLIPYPIVPVYLFMMGLPTETPDELAQSVRLAVRITDENPKAVKTFNIYTPYPGTELFDLAVAHGLRPPQRLEDWARFNFRNMPKDSPWVVPETRRLVEALDFPLMFLGKGHFVTPYKKTNPIVTALARSYYPLARYRVKHMDARFPIETKIVKSLGLFGRQA